MNHILYLRLIAAFMFVVMSVLQLFTFEKMPDIITSLIGVELGVYTSFIAAVIVLATVLAASSYLPLVLSPLFRKISAGLGFLALDIWLILNILNIDSGANAGFLGAKVPLLASWLSVTMLIVVACIAIAPYVLNHRLHLEKKAKLE